MAWAQAGTTAGGGRTGMTEGSYCGYAAGELAPEDPGMSRVPVQTDAERAVLGAALVNEQALALLTSLLRAEDFYYEAHREAYQAITEAAALHSNIDHVVVSPYATEQAALVLRQLYDAVPTSANARGYIHLVREAALARELLGKAEALAQKCLSPDYREARAMAVDLMESAMARQLDKGATSYKDSLEEFGRMVDERVATGGVTGIRTGLTDVDRALGGLQAGLSYVIAARPGMGKSLIIGQIMLTAARHGLRVLLQTPEMSKVQYMDRLAHYMADVDYEDGRAGKLNPAQVARVKSQAAILAELPIIADDKGTQTVRRVRANIELHRPDILLVDYLQYMTPDNPKESRANQVGQMSRDLTKIKADRQIPVVLAA